MSMKVLVTQHVTQLLLSKVVSLLSSASGALSAEQIQDIAAKEIGKYPALQFAENNDIGLCINRMLDQCMFRSITTEAALASQFSTMFAEDAVSAALMDEIAAGLATGLSAPLYELRTALPQAMETLVAKITAQVPPASDVVRPVALQQFTWGKLAALPVRSAAILFARERVACFKAGVATTYDTQNILRLLPYGTIKAVHAPETLKPALEQVLTTALAQDEVSDEARPAMALRVKKAVELLTTAKTFTKWTLDASAQLTSETLSAAVVRVTEDIDAIEDLARLITVPAMEALDADARTQSELLFDNVQTILANVQLLRAAMIFPKDRTLQNRLLLDTHVVQASVYDSFLADGGTEAMVQDYLGYMVLNPHMKIPAQGISPESVRDAHNKAHHAVVKNTKQLKDRQAAQRAQALQANLLHTLTFDYETGLRDGRYTRLLADVHQSRLNRAMAQLPSRPLEDIALEYLVGMKNDPLASALFQAINTELLLAMHDQTEITPVDIASATCKAVTKTLLSNLHNAFRPTKAA